MAYVGFKKLESSLSGKVRDPGAVAASIGRRKYGKAKFQKAAASGTKMRGMSHLPKGVSLTPEGDVGKHRAQEAYVLGTFSGCESMTKEKAGWQAMRDHSDSDGPYAKKGSVAVMWHPADDVISPNAGPGRPSVDVNVGSGLAPKKSSPFTNYAPNTAPPKGRTLPVRGEHNAD
jgi:hypothetical protein